MAKPAGADFGRRPRAKAGKGPGTGKGSLPVSDSSKKIDYRKGSGGSGGSNTAAAAAAAVTAPAKARATSPAKAPATAPAKAPATSPATASPGQSRHAPAQAARKPAASPAMGVSTVSKKYKPSKAQRRAQKLIKRTQLRAGDEDEEGEEGVSGPEGGVSASGATETPAVKSSKQSELDGKGVRLTGKLAARAGSKGDLTSGTGGGSRDPKGLHLSRMLMGPEGPEGGPVTGLDWGQQGAEPTTYRDEEEEEDEEDEEDEEEDEEEEEGGEGGVGVGGAGGVPKRAPIYNVEGIHEKMETFAWCDEAEWVETLVVTHDDDAAENVDVNDDLAREVALYAQAASCAKEALVKLREMGIPVVRPKDFYAEMVKGDSHMTKVQARLLSEQRELEEKEQRRKQRETKKYAKEVQAEKVKERQKAKKADIQEVEKWRKMRAHKNFDGDEDELPLDLGQDDEEGGAVGGKRKSPGKGKAPPPGGPKRDAMKKGLSKKQEVKNSKYGFGGPKRFQKRNDADSAGDMSGFKAGRSAGEKGGKGGKGAKGQRPGKGKRQQMKGKK